MRSRVRREKHMILLSCYQMDEHLQSRSPVVSVCMDFQVWTRRPTIFISCWHDTQSDAYPLEGLIMFTPAYNNYEDIPRDTSESHSSELRITRPDLIRVSLRRYCCLLHTVPPAPGLLINSAILHWPQSVWCLRLRHQANIQLLVRCLPGWISHLHSRTLPMIIVHTINMVIISRRLTNSMDGRMVTKQSIGSA